MKFEVGTKSWPLPPLLVFVPTVNRSLSSQIAWIGPESWSESASTIV